MPPSNVRASDPEKVCLIGAGSSGIVAAKTLLQHGVPFDCFERGSGVGGNWRFRNDNGMSASYASLHINTSKTRMAYSDYPMPEEYPDYPHHSQILRYFESYVDHFELRPHIRFRTTVERVEPTPEGFWEVTLDDGSRHLYRAVLVANGHHWDPKLPSFPGEFHGRSRHSHSYETPEGLAGKRVLVVGIGNSGVDIACESSRHAERTFLSTRHSAHILPKYAFGKPIDQYATPSSRYLPLAVQRLAYSLILGISRGPQERFGVAEPEHHILQAHPTISADLLHLVGHGRIAMKPDLSQLQGDRVQFADGSVEEIDEIIYATGYKVTFPFFSPEILETEENEVPLYRQVVHFDLPHLYFVGLIQPLGAIMPLAEAQAQWIAKLLTEECSLPPRKTMVEEYRKDREEMARRYVKSTRHTLQVDFYPYLYRMKREVREGRRRAR